MKLSTRRRQIVRRMGADAALRERRRHWSHFRAFLRGHTLSLMDLRGHTLSLMDGSIGMLSSYRLVMV